MTDEETRYQLAAILVRTAQAHHRATGGVNPDWAIWYSERTVDDVNQLLDLELTTEQFAEWLASADQRYKDEKPEMSWPKAYAGWLLSEKETS